jgi:hypothetical protein
MKLFSHKNNELLYIGMFVLMCSAAAATCSYSHRAEMSSCAKVCGAGKVISCDPPQVKCK